MDCHELMENWYLFAAEHGQTRAKTSRKVLVFRFQSLDDQARYILAALHM